MCKCSIQTYLCCDRFVICETLCATFSRIGNPDTSFLQIANMQELVDSIIHKFKAETKY